jgi:hypothetical protein
LSGSRLRIAKIVLLIVFTVGIIGLLTYYFKDYVRQVMALPVTRIIWFLQLLIDSTPQILFWGLLLIVFLIISIRSLSASNPPVLQAVPEPLQPPRRERIAFWIIQVANTLSGDQYSRVRMAGYLGDIALHLLAHQQKEDSEKIRRLILQKKLDIPPEIEACINARLRPVMEPRPGFWISIWHRFQRLFPFINHGSTQQKPLFPGQAPGDELEAIIHYLEEQLEVRDDSRN